MLQVHVLEFLASKSRQSFDFCFMPLVFLGGMKQEPEIHLCLQAIEKC